MNLFALQFDIAWEDKAVAQPARDSLIVLPEMFATGFSMNLAITRQGAGWNDFNAR